MCIDGVVFSLFQTLDIPTVWISLRDMCTGQLKKKVKCGGLISLGEEVKSKF